MGVAAEKDEAAREKVVFSPSGWGMRVSGWLSSETSALVDTALSALMGRKGADDARTLPERAPEPLSSLPVSALMRELWQLGLASARICRFMFPWRLSRAWKTLPAAVPPSTQTIPRKARSQCSKAASQQPEASTRAASAPPKQVGPMTV